MARTLLIAQRLALDADAVVVFDNTALNRIATKQLAAVDAPSVQVWRFSPLQGGSTPLQGGLHHHHTEV